LRLFLDRDTAEQAELYQGFFSGWKNLVGERIAAHSRVKDLQNGIVIVEVDHPGWMQMIQIKQSQVVDILRKKYPALEIRGLRLQLPWKNDRAAVSPGESRGAARRNDERNDEQEGEQETTQLPAPLIEGALDRLGRAIKNRRADSKERG
jgi:hypothetical protein